MTAEDILKKYLGKLPHKTKQNYYFDNTVEMLKEFAIYCCEKQREICAENAKIMAMNHSRISDEYKIDMGSIINSPLPEELL